MRNYKLIGLITFVRNFSKISSNFEAKRMTFHLYFHSYLRSFLFPWKKIIGLFENSVWSRLEEILEWVKLK